MTLRLKELALAFGALALSAPFTAHAADLAQIYQLAKTNDPTIQAAIATHKAATKQVPLARSAFRPQINASFTASLNDIDDDLSETFQSTQLTLSISQSLYHRSNAALLNQAELAVLQADATLEAARQALITRTAETYFDVLRSEADLAFSQAELQAIGRQKEQAEKRFEVGLATVIDVRESQAQFDLAVAQEVAAQGSLDSALDSLRSLTASTIDTLDPLKDDIPLVVPEPAIMEEWVQISLDQNLDLASARLQLDIAGLEVRSERGVRFPTLDLLAVGSTGRTTQNGRDDDDTVDAGELRLELTLPIYSGGSIGAQVARAKAEVSTASAQLREQELATSLQARESYRGVTTNISRVKALRQALDSTQKSAEASDAGFRAGTRTSVDVLSALRDTFSARSDFVNARYDYVLNTLSLKSAAGTLGEQDLMAVNALLEQEAN